MLNKLDAYHYGIKLRELFPNTKFDPNSNRLTKYQRDKLSRAIRAKIAESGIVLEPDRPDIYSAAGFFVSKGQVFTKADKVRIHTLYYADADYEYYSADFFGGQIHAQLVPLFYLPEFLARQREIDESLGNPWYDLITLREGDRAAWGGEAILQYAKRSADEMIAFLEQYKRQGDLIGQGGSYDYIQVCYIKLNK